MAKLYVKSSEKAGLPPGSLIHVGERKVDEAKITIVEYDKTAFQEKAVKSIEDYTVKDKPAVTWINVAGLHQVEIIEGIGKIFSLHPLTQEDILHTDQRPKMEEFEDYIYVVLKILSFDDEEHKIEVEQLSIVSGSNFVISLHESGKDIFNPVRERIRDGKGHVKHMGADYLAYTLIDTIVDNYFVILEKFGEIMELIEDQVITDPTPETVKTIHHLKSEMVFLRKSIWPLREVVSRLEREDSPLIHESTVIYFKDIYDHTIQIIDTVETFRDILSGLLDVYLSSVSNKMNEVMKVLTIIATIFVPLTFITGVYGMNFKFMPILKWHWGYPAVVFGMFTMSVLMIIYFRIKKWW